MLNLLLHYEFLHSTTTPRLQWAQYQKLNYWLTSLVLMVGLVLPTTTFTGYVLSKGRMTLTGPISVVFPCLKVKETPHSTPERKAVYWCIGKHFIITQQHWQWAATFAFWYIVWFLTGTFVMMFEVLDMSQTQIAQVLKTMIVSRFIQKFLLSSTVQEMRRMNQSCV